MTCFRLAVAVLVSFAICSVTRAAEGEKKKLLFFTKSSGFEHPCIKRQGDELGYAEKVLVELGKKNNIDVTASKDGSVFTPEKLAQFDAIAFETTGDLTTEGTDKTPAMPAGGKEALLHVIAAGKGFIGFHCASDTFHTPKPEPGEPLRMDPYIQMLGGEFIVHGEQQTAKMKVADKKFPGLESLDDFEMYEEWYALKYFSPDIHVLLVQQTEGMKNPMYQRPPYPAAWARMQGKGRVFFTSMGHREDVWDNPKFQQVASAGLNWILGRTEADVKPNLKEVTPEAEPPIELEFREKKEKKQ